MINSRWIQSLWDGSDVPRLVCFVHLLLLSTTGCIGEEETSSGDDQTPADECPALRTQMTVASIVSQALQYRKYVGEFPKEGEVMYPLSMGGRGLGEAYYYDGWEAPLAYKVSDCEIRVMSSGSDRVMGSDDDVGCIGKMTDNGPDIQFIGFPEKGGLEAWVCQFSSDPLQLESLSHYVLDEVLLQAGMLFRLAKGYSEKDLIKTFPGPGTAPHDGWGTPLRCNFSSDGIEVRSAGADKVFMTNDDVVGTTTTNCNPREVCGPNGSAVVGFDA